MSAKAKTRIDHCFERLGKEKRSGLITFVTAGDPNPNVSLELIRQLPAVGADIIELGMPFTDPIADGPSIQASSMRALQAGASMVKTLKLVEAFRAHDEITPIVFMGYYNPIYIYGRDKFLFDAIRAGVDGLIVVDLPPEEDEELCVPALKAGLNFIRLATPTTDNHRLKSVLNNTSGFVYYVSITGITGTHEANASLVESDVRRIKQHTDLPVAVGFGIKTQQNAAAIARVADAAVVGSAIVDRIAAGLDAQGAPKANLIDEVLKYVQTLSNGVAESRRQVAR